MTDGRSSLIEAPGRKPRDTPVHGNKADDWLLQTCANCGASGLSRWKRPQGVFIFIGPCCRKSFGGVVHD